MENHWFQLNTDGALFFSAFILIFIAELPDKTAMAILILASRHHPFAVFTGVAPAFLIQNLVAVLFGNLLGLLPPHVIHLGSGLLFLLLALLMWFRRARKDTRHWDSKADFLKTAWTSFIVVFIAEWGDLTQLASATLVAKTHQPLIIFIASTLALWSTSVLAIALGHHAKKFLKPRALQSIAAAAFTVVGILLLSGIWDK